jgi:hypothetical protein
MDIQIENGKAYCIYSNGAPELHPSIEIVRGYTDAVEEGWVWTGKSFLPPPQTEDARTYADKRAAEYPSVGDQLDALFHAGVFPEEMASAIQVVKDKYPKD